ALREKIARLDAESLVRERFVSLLMHDLRGPLTIAKTNAQLLLASAEHEPKLLASRIVGSIDHLERMIDDLLDADRIRAGQNLPLTIEECSLTSLAREVIDDLTTVH